MFRPHHILSRSLPAAAGRRRLLHTATRAPSRGSRTALTLAAAAGITVAAAAYRISCAPEVFAEAQPPARLLSAQERRKARGEAVQVKNSVEHPGVYAWGDNTGRVVAPDSDQKAIKTPRRIEFFDNTLLRDLKLSKDAGVAVTSRGDILQWGSGYDAACRAPEPTLRGKNISKIALTADKIVALSRDGKIYAVPISKQYQKEGAKYRESSWVPGLSADSEISYRMVKPKLGSFENIADIATGLDHALIMTSHGRVFTSAQSFTFPARGQLGIPGLTWATRPAGPSDAPHELHLPSFSSSPSSSPSPSSAAAIAAGDYHSVILGTDGQVFTFGDNLNGQLGLEYDPEKVPPHYDSPVCVMGVGGWAQGPGVGGMQGGGVKERVTAIAAGGCNSFFVKDVEKDVERDVGSGARTTEVWACGAGIYGGLGNGKWTHVQNLPIKVKALSGLLEYDERTSRIAPIGVKSVSVGANHAAATMSNTTTSSSPSTTSTPSTYGHDVLWWGNNEHYQLGSGKRNNLNTPSYIPPLDRVAAAGLAESLKGLVTGALGGGKDGADTEKGKAGKEGGKTGEGGDRFQVSPLAKVAGGRTAEQRVVCGRGNTAVFSACSA